MQIRYIVDLFMWYKTVSPMNRITNLCVDNISYIKILIIVVGYQIDYGLRKGKCSKIF